MKGYNICLCNRIFVLICAVLCICICLSCKCTEGAAHADDSEVWRTTGIVFEGRDISGSITDVYAITEDDYVVRDIKVLSENSEGDYPVVFCSASLSYNSGDYSLNEVIYLLEESDIYVNVETDGTLYTDARLERSDSYTGYQWYLNAVNADEAWDSLQGEPGEGVVVAVIDTGVDYTHRDLKNNMWTNDAELYGISGVDDDGNGIVDDIYGADFSTENKSDVGKGDPLDTDPEGHGTHVAGVIAMTRGNGGGCGIAYGSRIMAVKAGNSDGRFKVSSVISALDYAVNMGADVINMSFGTYSESSVFKSMLERIKDRCVLVAAAGNDGYVTTDYSGEGAHDVYPGSYPCVLGVMAADNNNVVTSWSNYDYEQYTDSEYEIAAPGYRILSTIPSGKYAYMSGTSMAAPMVSAAAAVLYGVIDRKNMESPALYVYGQLTCASGHIASRTDMNGVNHTYPMLNLYNSLKSSLEDSSGLDININRYNYYYNEGAMAFDKELEVDTTAGNITINCGYRINNMWSKAKNVSVNVKAESTLCKNTDSEVDISELPAISSLTISCHSIETYTFEMDCSKAGTYSIPVVYTVKAAMENSENTSTWQYMDILTIKVKEAQANSDDSTNADASYNTSPTSGNDAIAVNNSVVAPSKVKITRVTKKSEKKYKNILYWKKASNAKKYIIYYAKKRKGTYRKLAVTSAKKYTHSFKKKRTYYYKIRAYNTGNGKKVYGKYSSVITVKRG